MKRSKPLTRAVTVLTVILGAALCAAVLALYSGGVRQRTLSGSATAPIFTPEAVKACGLWVLPVAALWLVLVIAAAVKEGTGRAPGAARLREGSRKRGTDAKGPATRQGRSFRPAVPFAGQEETRGRRWARAALLAAAAALILLGILNGGLNDVLVKAINICTECIGLG